MKKPALGRGLGALISEKNIRPAHHDNTTPPATPASPEVGTGFLELPLSQIDPSSYQPRQMFDEDKLEALSHSIAEQGLVQPIVVRQKKERFELIAGERRFRAVKRLGWTVVPAVVKDVTDDRMLQLALVENLQRDDLNPIETALSYKALQEELHLKHETIAERLGISRSQITNMLRLLDLPEEVKGMVSCGTLSAGAARAILALPDALSQIRMAKKAVADGMSVRDLERAVQKKDHQPSPKRSNPVSAKSTDPQVQSVEDRLRQHLGTKVTIQDHHGKGTIQIEYYTPSDVTRILDKMGLANDELV